MVKLTYLVTAIKFLGIFFVGWLPHGKEELAKLGQDGAAGGRSKVGGFVFLTVALLAIAYTISSGLLNIMAPGWMGES